MNFKFALTGGIGWLLTIGAAAQSSPTFNLGYTTELQTDFRGQTNWVNLLRTETGIEIGKGVKTKLATISICRTSPERLTDDLQTFSNIEEENLPLALAVLGLEWNRNTWIFFIGIRNLNEDYFISEATSLFTNSSCGLFPTISANWPIANYPTASMGADCKRMWNRWLFEISVYNGRGYNRWTCREHPFRFCPTKDGLLTLTSIQYNYHDSNYYLGSALYYGLPLSDESGTEMQAKKNERKKIQTTVWTYAEQKVGPNIRLLIQTSHCFAPQATCRNYFGAGLVLQTGKQEVGVVSNYATFDTTYENATELTWKTPLNRYIYLQPTLHLIRNQSRTLLAGLLRVGFLLTN